VPLEARLAREGALLTTETVLAEALTLLQVRRAPVRAVDRLLALLGGMEGAPGALVFVRTGDDVLRDALEDFREAYPGRLGFTDWTLVHTARALGADAVATFDRVLAAHVRVVG
jgi:predicted nucleic acid-binding protein